MGPLVVSSAFAAVFLCAPFLLIAANRSGRLARWDERERKRLARPWNEIPPPRWLQWVLLVLLVSYLPAEAFIWQRRHNLALVLLQVPSILWLAVWTVGWRWRVKLLQRWTRHPAGDIERE
jgi:hypothetical protein